MKLRNALLQDNQYHFKEWKDNEKKNVDKKKIFIHLWGLYQSKVLSTNRTFKLIHILCKSQRERHHSKGQTCLDQDNLELLNLNIKKVALPRKFSLFRGTSQF